MVSQKAEDGESEEVSKEEVLDTVQKVQQSKGKVQEIIEMIQERLAEYETLDEEEKASKYQEWVRASEELPVFEDTMQKLDETLALLATAINEEDAISRFKKYDLARITF